MTRWARGGPANKKKEESGTSWEQMGAVKQTDVDKNKRWKKHEESQMKNKDAKVSISQGGIIKKGKKMMKRKPKITFIKPAYSESESDSDKPVKNSLNMKNDIQSKKKIEKLKKKMKVGKPDYSDSESEKESTFQIGSSARKASGLAADLERLCPKRKNVGSDGEISKPILSHAERLKAIANSSTSSKSEDKDLLEFVKKDQRRENRRMKRIDETKNKKACFLCRETGHTMADCPKAKKDVDQGTDICFKCGSTEHSMHDCKARVPQGQYPYAKCFICKEMGHLSSQCPDNPRGLYPNGGCCRVCGLVEHYKKDCPELQKEQGIQDFKVERMDLSTSVDEELSLNKPFYLKPKAKGPKIVKF